MSVIKKQEQKAAKEAKTSKKSAPGPEQPGARRLRTGILVPTAIEAEAYFQLWPDLELYSTSPWQMYRREEAGQTITLILSFIGPANAAAAAEHLIGLGLDRLFNSGSAGAIDPLLLPGDIVLGSSCKILCSREILAVRRSLVMAVTPIRYMKNGQSVYKEELAADDHLLTAAEQVAEKLLPRWSAWPAAGWPTEEAPRQARLQTAAIGSLDGWTKGLENLNFIRDNFAVAAEDMESAYVAQIAAIHDLPFLAVRAISNNEYRQTLEREEIFPAVKAAAHRAASLVIELVNSANSSSSACSANAASSANSATTNCR